MFLLFHETQYTFSGQAQIWPEEETGNMKVTEQKRLLFSLQEPDKTKV
jgi:hypothetical protein